MGIDQTHLVPMTLGHPGDQVLNVADGGSNSCHSLPRPEQGIDIQLLPTLDELEVKIEVLEIAGELAARLFNLHDLSVHRHGGISIVFEANIVFIFTGDGKHRLPYDPPRRQERAEKP